jgi:hypothetical protein
VPAVAVPDLTGAALGLIRGAQAGGWRAADPYDGLARRWPSFLTGGPRRRQAIVQAHARSPIDIRRLYGRPGVVIAKALAVFGSAGLRVHALTRDFGARCVAVEALELLAADHHAGEAAWGYPWDVQTRWSFYPAGSPNVVSTAFAVSALLEAERELGRTDLGDRARAAAHWVTDVLWIRDGGFFAYHPHSRANIHNANLLGAWLVWAAHGHDPAARRLVVRAVERTVDAQRPDGSWAYGEGAANLGWADSFHTGYVLTCLARLRELDPRIDEALARGAGFYARFFGPRGEARLWPDRDHPEDGHSAGTGLTTVATSLRSELFEQQLLENVAVRVLASSIRNGHVTHRRYRWGLRTSVQYQRWCDAHVALGLADAATVITGRDDPAPVPRTGATKSS